jgi:hypothetical protein
MNKYETTCPFEAGDKVVCVDADFERGLGKNYTAMPEEGRVYCVRGIGLEKSPDGKSWFLMPVWCVQLVGIFGRPMPDGSERGFMANRFALLSTVRENNRERLAARSPVLRARDFQLSRKRRVKGGRAS